MSDPSKEVRREVAAPVDEVVLLEDRGHVYRRGRIELEAGRNRLLIAAVAPVLVDKTLSVGLSGGEASLVSARVVRREVFRDPDTDESALGELERRRRELDTRISELEGELSVARRHTRGLTDIVGMSLEELAGDVAWGREVGPEWSDRLDKLRQREGDLRESIVTFDHEMEQLIESRQRLDQRIATLASPASRASATIEIDLQCAAAGSVDLRVDYVVPGACWRPYHTATLLEEDAPTVTVATDACVWQRTGEDWSNAQLVFSTERASLGTTPPRLHTDLLSWRKKDDRIVVETRQQVVATTGLGVDTRTTSPELPGIDDGGEALNLRAAARSDVPSDGRPYRIRIGDFTAPADRALVSFPELSPCAFTRTTLANKGGRPLLAGPVDLIRSSGYVGRTSVLFVAPDERFDLGWGPEAELRIRRTEDPSKARTKLLSSWVTQERAIDIKISNLGDEPRTVVVSERVPVSEIDKVKIEFDFEQTTGGRRPDGNGFVAWEITVPAYGQQSIELAYTVKKHEDVVGL